MNTTLIIMAAGIGSRFGQGIKQLEVMNPHQDGSKGEIIIDYSIYDAVEAGFNKIVFVIRKQIEKEFKEVIGDRIEEALRKYKVTVDYAFQEVENLPEGFTVPEARTKPWGTGQAILAAEGIVNEPFAIINADDYYGKEAFVKLHDFLIENYEKNQNTDKLIFAMAGFILKNTLSANGSVTRGVCEVDQNNMVKRIVETKGIKAEGNNKIVCDNPEVSSWINPNSIVSMNMWAAYPEFLAYLKEDFKNFLNKADEDELTKEYLVPVVVDELLQKGKASLEVLATDDKWIGVTYQEDADSARADFKLMLDGGKYPKDLWK